MVMFHSYVNVYQRVGHRTRIHDFQCELLHQFPYCSLCHRFPYDSIMLRQTLTLWQWLTYSYWKWSLFSPHEIRFMVDLPIKNGESWWVMVSHDEIPMKNPPWYSQQFCGHQLSTASWQQLRHRGRGRCGRLCGASAWGSAPALRIGRDPVLKEWTNGIPSGQLSHSELENQSC